MMTSERALDSQGSSAAEQRWIRWRSVIAVSLATMLGMSAWFSASFIVSDLQALWSVPDSMTGFITFSLQAGFIVGALISATLGLADRIGSRVIFLSSSLLAGGLNALLLLAPSYAAAVTLRMMVGVMLAGIYPVAIKEVLRWVSPGLRGSAVGLLIAALTLGSAVPHLISTVVSTAWEGVIVVTSLLVVAGGAIFYFGVPRQGPAVNSARFSLGAAFGALRNREVRLVNIAYFGHMWELYAMWTWVGLFLGSRASGVEPELVSLVAFAVIGIGALGAGLAGPLGDRFGKERIATLSLVLSGGCALLILLSSGWAFPVVVMICAAWGFWVIADSGLLSSLLGDHCPPEHMGSVVTIQLAGGYVVSGVSILLVPLLSSILSWEVSLPLLALGPLVAILALRALRR